MALCICLLEGPRGARFLLSEVPLYMAFKGVSLPTAQTLVAGEGGGHLLACGLRSFGFSHATWPDLHYIRP